MRSRASVVHFATTLRADLMQIHVKLMGMLKAKAPLDGCLEVHEGATIADALTALDIPADSVQVITVNGDLERARDRVLSEQDELSLIPPVGGG